MKLSEDQRGKVAQLLAEKQAEIDRFRSHPGNKGQPTWSQRQELDKRFEEQVRTLLTAEQQKQWSTLKRLEFATALGPAREILDKEVRVELGLSDTQALAIDELQKEFCRECERIDSEITSETPAGTFIIKVHEADVTFDARLGPLLEKTLHPAQLSRWHEIQWQRSAARDGPAVLLHESVVEYLALTHEQRQEIEVAANECKRQEDEARKKSGWFAAMRVPAANLEKCLSILSPSQTRRWNILLGKPFHDRRSQFMNSGADAKKEHDPKD